MVRRACGRCGGSGADVGRAVQPALDDVVDLATRNSQQGATGAPCSVLLPGSGPWRTGRRLSGRGHHVAGRSTAAQGAMARPNAPRSTSRSRRSAWTATAGVGGGASEDGGAVLPTRPAVGGSGAPPAAGARAMTGPAAPVVGSPFPRRRGWRQRCSGRGAAGHGRWLPRFGRCSGGSAVRWSTDGSATGADRRARQTT